MPEPLSAESMRKFFNEQREEEFLRKPESTCGPFHPGDIEKWKKENMRCPQCGKSARRHE